MKKIFFYCFLTISLNSFSQQVFYAAAKTGLSMRSEAATNAKVIEKIAYGQKLVTLTDTSGPHPINTEGFNGSWQKVKYNNKTGYVVSSYLLPEVPPKANVKTVKDYLAQLSTPVAAPLIIKKGQGETIEGSATTLKKQLFKNGMEWHQTEGYEYGNTVYILPGFTIEQAFLLLRIINEFEEVITPGSPFPSANIPATEANKQHGVQVERETWGDGKPGPVIKIKLSSAEAGYSDLEIFDLEGQCVIFYSSGV